MAQEPKSLDEVTSQGNEKKETLRERNMRAALERAEQAEAEKKAAMEAAIAERKNDGRKYDLEVEGMNIGDSLMRRMAALDEKVMEGQQELLAQELDEDVEETPSEDVAESAEDAVEEDDDFDLDDVAVEDDDDDFFEAAVVEEESAPQPKKEEKSVVVKPEAIDVEEAGIDKKLSDRELPNQNELKLDEEDFDDIDLNDIDEDPAEEEDSDNSDLSEAELDALKDEIRKKLTPEVSATNIVISNKPVSVNRILALDQSKDHAADWPLMASGKLISMKRFSGPEIEDLNQQINARNRFNTMRDIYRNIYNHIIGEKPEFENWLRETPFVDSEHIYMAAYKASFFGANYIPMNCTNPDCDHIFLTDDIDMETEMVEFKDDAAKKRFYAIMNGEKVSSVMEPEFVPLSANVGVSLREPSIYNTIFENSVLDQKFIDKYEKVLTLMVYIDKMYLIRDGQAYPIAVKEDKGSIAKSAKYRIATYSKAIQDLPSDAYNILMAKIAERTNAGEDVTYCFPEVKCPKCGAVIEKSPAQANQLLFSRHRLSLLTAQS